MDSDSWVGICASKIVVYGKNIIDSAGDGFSTFLKGFKRGEGENVLFYSQKEYIFGACAGACLYRRKMLEEIGFLDEDFFLIHEDTDLNLRAQLYGWKVLYVPDAIVYHKVRSTIGNLSDASIYFTIRNNEFVRIKNLPLIFFSYFSLELLVGSITEFVYFAIKHKRPNLYFKAKMDALRFLPKMLNKRAVILKDIKTGPGYLINVMTHGWETGFLKRKIKKFLRE
jgi:GT2 family glycosyltransferase